MTSRIGVNSPSPCGSRQVWNCDHVVQNTLLVALDGLKKVKLRTFEGATEAHISVRHTSGVSHCIAQSTDIPAPGT